MNFEWDDAKAAKNLTKHGVAFEDAKLVYDNHPVIVHDDRKDYGEPRFIAYGEVAGVPLVLVVVHTERGEIHRIISARAANKRERKFYHDHR